MCRLEIKQTDPVYYTVLSFRPVKYPFVILTSHVLRQKLIIKLFAMSLNSCSLNNLPLKFKVVFY